MKLNCVEPLSNLAFNFNLRHYIEFTTFDTEANYDNVEVGRCRSTVSNLKLKPRLVSALDARM